MIILVLALVAISTVPLGGGRLRRLAGLPIRDLWLAWIAILLQTLLVRAPWDTPHRVGQILHVVSYAIAAAFVVANRRLPGMSIIGVGGGLNLCAIVANRGVMPASTWALRTAGRAPESGFSNSGAVAHARLAWLGDVFAIPHRIPLANVFSVGDVVTVIGVGYLAHRWCRRADPAPFERTASEPVDAVAVE